MSSSLFNISDIINGIILGDCDTDLQKFPSDSVDCIISDPPYGTNRKNDGYDDTETYVFNHYLGWLQQMARILKPNKHLYLFVPTLHLGKWISGVSQFLTFKNLLAFPVYTNNRFNLKNNYGFNAQYVIFAHKGNGTEFNDINWIQTSDCWFNDKRNTNPKEYTYIYPNYFGNIIYANHKNNKERKAKHPNEKNEELIQKFIEISTQPNEIVMDCFMGSGRTAIASLSCGRKFVGIEKNPEYHQLSMDEIQDLMKKQLQTKQMKEKIGISNLNFLLAK